MKGTAKPLRLVKEPLGRHIALGRGKVLRWLQCGCDHTIARADEQRSECLCAQFMRNARHIRQDWRSFLGRWLISSLIVTILFWLMSNYSQHSDVLREWDDWSQDIVMALNKNRDAPRNPTLPMKQVYDIDDAAYREWGSPVLLPRDKVLSLIQGAERAGASIILVDIDLSRPSDDLAGAGVRLTDNDRALTEYLEKLNNSDDPDRPIVILPRSLRKPLREGALDESALFEPVPSFLDPFLPEQKRVFWGSAQFAVEEDSVIRRWRLAEAYCSKGRLDVLPSVQLLAARAGLAAGTNSDKAAALRELSRQLHPGQFGQAPACMSARGYGDLTDLMERYPISHLPDELRLSGSAQGPSISAEALGRTSRIVFRLFPGPDVRKRQIEVIPADEVSGRQGTGLDALGRAVLIGASFEESHDLHRRPFHDRMLPGVVIIANAIDTLEQYGEIRPIPLSMLLVAIILVANLLWSASVELLPFPAEIALWLIVIPLGLYSGLVFIERGWGTFSVGLLLLVSQFIHSDLMKKMGTRLIAGACRGCRRGEVA